MHVLAPAMNRQNIILQAICSNLRLQYEIDFEEERAWCSESFSAPPAETDLP